VEILESRYPIILKTFSLRPNSGGSGRFKGGNGLVRELKFREDLQLCILTERRVFQPYGMAGGSNGKRGRNLLLRTNGNTINLGSRSTVDVQRGVCTHV
jgi:5-oxoprolinase (ATP-hydrolysing)